MRATLDVQVVILQGSYDGKTLCHYCAFLTEQSPIRMSFNFCNERKIRGFSCFVAFKVKANLVSVWLEASLQPPGIVLECWMENSISSHLPSTQTPSPRKTSKK